MSHLDFVVLLKALVIESFEGEDPQAIRLYSRMLSLAERGFTAEMLLVHFG